MCYTCFNEARRCGPNRAFFSCKVQRRNHFVTISFYFATEEYFRQLNVPRDIRSDRGSKNPFPITYIATNGHTLVEYLSRK